jgi:hypothetical protein
MTSSQHPKIKQIEKDYIARRYKPSYHGENSNSNANINRVAMVYGA